MKESRLGFLVDGLFVYLSLLLGLCTAVLVFCMCVFVFEGKAEGPRLGFLATWWTLYVGGSSRDEKAVAMVIGDKGLESTVAPASIYLRQFIECLMFNMVEVLINLRHCPSEDLCVGARVA